MAKSDDDICQEWVMTVNLVTATNEDDQRIQRLASTYDTSIDPIIGPQQVSCMLQTIRKAKRIRSGKF